MFWMYMKNEISVIWPLQILILFIDTKYSLEEFFSGVHIRDTDSYLETYLKNIAFALSNQVNRKTVIQ